MDALTSQLGAVSLTSPPPPPPLIVYLLAKTDSKAVYFHCSTPHFFVTRHASVPDPFESGRLYGLRYDDDRRAVFSDLGERHQDMLLKRWTKKFSGVACDVLVMHALLLGSRIRDYEQECATITSCSPLVITMPFRPGFLKDARFRTETGTRIDVRVDNKINNEKTMTLFCTLLAGRPERGARLQFIEDDPRLPVVTKVLEAVYKGERTVDNRELLNRIYGKGEEFVHPAVDQKLIRIRKEGRDVLLNAEQSEAVRAAERDLALIVESPPGSGKTLIAAAMAVNFSEDELQLFLSTANVPVLNMAEALAKIDYGDRKICHLLSQDKKATMKSPFAVVVEVDAWRIAHLERELAYARTRAEKQSLLAEIRRVRQEAFSDAVGGADIILATVDMVLMKLLQPKNAKHPCLIQAQLETRVRRIVIDEASQLTEAALNALIVCFPMAKIVLIGDSKQMPPFKYTEGDVVSELAARSAIDVVKRKRNVRTINLRHVYRASPSMVKHYSDAFYDGTLVSDKPESSRVQLSCITQGVSRCLFVDVKNGKTELSGTSLYNDAELGCLDFIITRLRNAGYGAESVMLIAYYEAQRKLVKDRLAEDYEILTVDSAQGREKPIVIVLTTATSKASEFLASATRSNVAVSRHQEALIVLGSETLLQETEPWKQFLTKEYFSFVSYGRQ